jgi:hypothetical protein
MIICLKSHTHLFCGYNSHICDITKDFFVSLVAIRVFFTQLHLFYSDSLINMLFTTMEFELLYLLYAELDT